MIRCQLGQGLTVDRDLVAEMRQLFSCVHRLAKFEQPVYNRYGLNLRISGIKNILAKIGLRQMKIIDQNRAVVSIWLTESSRVSLNPTRL